MKKIEAIIRPEKLEAVKSAILTHTDVKGLTVAQVLGCGQQLGWKEYVRGQEVTSSLLPKIQLSLVVPDQLVEPICELIITASRTNDTGDGKIFITEVLEAIRIRTGERGEQALLPSEQ